MSIDRSQRRYQVEATQIEVIEESGVDVFGSDELLLRYAVGADRLHTSVYGDLDEGDRRPIRPRQRCIWPAEDEDETFNQEWACERHGRNGPIEFLITIYEYDGLVRDFILPPYSICVPSTNDLLRDCRDDERTTLGSYRRVFTQVELETRLPSPGNTHTERLVIDNCSDAVTVRDEVCSYASWLPTYFAYGITVRVTRLADQAVDPPVLR